MAEQLNHGEWKGNTAGSTWMHRTLIASFKIMNLRFVYLGMAVFVVPMYMLFAHQGYITMYHYFRQRQGYGVLKSFLHVYLNHYRFGQVILDRFASYAGQKFEFELDGMDLFERLSAGKEGFMILSSHIGNYELAGYSFSSMHKRYNALVYSGEAETVMENRNRLLSKHNIRMIAMKEDMSHVFMVNEALVNGEIVSAPSDRVFGSPRNLTCDFMGGKGRFPLGPFMMALQRGLPTITIFVMKISPYRYKVYIREVKCDERPYANRQEKAQNLAQHFAAEMEKVIRLYPDQWFNYFEFWNNDKE